MSKVAELEQRKRRILQELADCHPAISGNLSRGAIGSRHYWRITWKQKQKTKIQYVRNDEVRLFRKGIQAFSRAKQLLQRLGALNQQLLIQQRTERS